VEEEKPGSVVLDAFFFWSSGLGSVEESTYTYLLCCVRETKGGDDG